jgi:hypothetical protein
LSPAAQSTMATDTRVYLDEADRQELDRLTTELLQTVGALTAILECAALAQPKDQARFMCLARDSSTRGTRTLKSLLWKWARLREDFAEQTTARTPDHATDAPKAENVEPPRAKNVEPPKLEMSQIGSKSCP